MIIRKTEEAGARCGYECFDKRSGKMGDCGAPALVHASGRPGAFLCEECARFVAGTAKAEYRVKEILIDPVTKKEIVKERAVSSAEFWDRIKGR